MPWVRQPIGDKQMSPDHSNYRNGDFQYETDEAEYRRDSSNSVTVGPRGRRNAPSGNRRYDKTKSSVNGLQRRRNKHWTW